MNFRRFRIFSLAISLPFILVACGGNLGVTPAPTNTESSSNSEQPSFSQFQDVPIPTNAEMNLDRTVILGAPESWIGRLTLETSHNPVNVFNFFKQRTREFGWQEVTSIRSATSFLTYTQATRVLTIQITGKTLRGSEVVMTVSPKGPSLGSPPVQVNPGIPKLNQ